MFKTRSGIPDDCRCYYELSETGTVCHGFQVVSVRGGVPGYTFKELSILVHRTSEESQIVWVGEDKRFGVASYRVRAANFLMKPITEKEIWISLDRCIKRLQEEHAIDGYDCVNIRE